MSRHDVRDDQLPSGAGTGPRDVPIVPAASVLALRGEPFRVLLMRRSDRSTFVPGNWVFPGGTVEPADRGADEDATFRACAVRELREEAGIELRAEDLVLTSRWVTPEGVPKRFDTAFYLAAVGAAVEPRADAREAVELRWFDPGEAVAENAAGRLAMVFPTIRNLMDLRGQESIPALLAARRAAAIPVTRPVIREVNGKKTVTLPDEA